MGFGHANLGARRDARDREDHRAVKPIDVAVRMLKVTLLAMCFSTEISPVARELSEKEKDVAIVRGAAGRLRALRDRGCLQS